MVCADTSFLVALERGDARALEKLQKLEESGETIYVTAITVAEYYRGAHGSKDSKAALKSAKEMLDRFAILDLDYRSAIIWGDLSLVLKSNAIGDRDLFIASISLASGQTLITKNLRHFERVPGLQVEEW